MAMQLFNHNQGKNGSHWVNLMRNGKADQILVVAIDIGKYTHKTLMTNVYQDVLVAPFEMDASLTGFKLLVAKIEETCNAGAGTFFKKNIYIHFVVCFGIYFTRG